MVGGECEKSMTGNFRDIHEMERPVAVLMLLREIIRATDLHSKRLAKATGLTTPQIVVLQAIRDLGEVTAGAISSRVSLSQATVSAILDRLESRGLIERYRSTMDRRVVHSRLTRAGRRALLKAPPLLQERFLRKFASLAPAEQQRIIDALGAVAEMMGDGPAEVAPLNDGGAEAMTPTRGAGPAAGS